MNWAARVWPPLTILAVSSRDTTSSPVCREGKWDILKVTQVEMREPTGPSELGGGWARLSHGHEAKARHIWVKWPRCSHFYFSLYISFWFSALGIESRAFRMCYIPIPCHFLRQGLPKSLNSAHWAWIYDSPASASPSAELIGMCHGTQLSFSLFLFTFRFSLGVLFSPDYFRMCLIHSKHHILL